MAIIVCKYAGVGVETVAISRVRHYQYNLRAAVYVSTWNTGTTSARHYWRGRTVRSSTFQGKKVNYWDFVSLFRKGTLLDTALIKFMVYYGFGPGFIFSYLSTGQEIGWKERLRYDRYCVEWDVKPQLNSINRPLLSFISQGSDNSVPYGLHARLCRTFLVSSFSFRFLNDFLVTSYLWICWTNLYNLSGIIK